MTHPAQATAIEIMIYAPEGDTWVVRVGEHTPDDFLAVFRCALVAAGWTFREALQLDFIGEEKEMKLCSDCRWSSHRFPLFVMQCHRNERKSVDPVDGSVDIKGVIDCELARDPAWLEDGDDPRYCGPEGRLWEPEE